MWHKFANAWQWDSHWAANRFASDASVSSILTAADFSLQLYQTRQSLQPRHQFSLHVFHAVWIMAVPFIKYNPKLRTDRMWSMCTEERKYAGRSEEMEERGGSVWQEDDISWVIEMQSDGEGQPEKQGDVSSHRWGRDSTSARRSLTESAERKYYFLFGNGRMCLMTWSNRGCKRRSGRTKMRLFYVNCGFGTSGTSKWITKCVIFTQMWLTFPHWLMILLGLRPRAKQMCQNPDTHSNTHPAHDGLTVYWWTMFNGLRGSQRHEWRHHKQSNI